MAVVGAPSDRGRQVSGDVRPGRYPIALVIPCLNEEPTIGTVIEDFRREVPGATIIVVDNGSSDATVAVAERLGATVLHENRRGKGYAVRAAFRRVDADVYAMVDGDDTYPAAAIHDLLAPVVAGTADMVVGSRLMSGTTSQFGRPNRLGNWLYPTVLRLLLGSTLTDVLSGYRVMSREFVRNLPLVSKGFEIEAELTVKAIERGYRVEELPTDLRPRPSGSHSKIRIVSDGWLILWTIILLFRDYRPTLFFAGLGLLSMVVGLVPGIVVIREFLETGLVPRLPSAVLAVAFELAGILLVGIGLILASVRRRFEELEAKLESLLNEPDLP